MAKKYITTTLPYVNSDPHIGHAFEFIEADAIARYWRLMGHDVFFNTGTDEHGQKIAQKADEKGESRQAYVDHFAGRFKESIKLLNLSYDAFIRTTDETHVRAAQELWRRCEAAGDIYKKAYKGLYCVGDEMFMKESELVDGRCPNHPNLELQEIEEENYFFRLSNYQSYLEEYLARPGVIVPEWRREEALNFVRKGLEDFSISREVKRMDWGIPIPNDPSHVMYVWFDALTNYISTLGWPDDSERRYVDFWQDGEPMQIAGKDQIRFQSIMWQAMLHSAKLAPTHRILYHGFINSGGQKMSKSLGNVISPFELVDRFGTDATRYLLLRHVHPFEDADITWERLIEWYNANLANGIGNQVARVMKLATTHLSEPVRVEDEPLEAAFCEKLDKYLINEALDLVFEHVGKGDLYIQETQPFKGIKSEDPLTQQKARDDIEKMVRHIYKVAAHLEPFMPETSREIKDAVRTHIMPRPLFLRVE